MPTRFIRRSVVAAATGALFALTSMAGAAVNPVDAGAPLTSGTTYDRNPSVVQDGGVTRAFFARSENPDCNRLAGCDADNTTYDLYEVDSTDGGATWAAPQLVLDHSAFPASPYNNPAYGRTIAATRTAAGDVQVFWASGGDTSSLVYGVDPAGPASWTWSSRSDLPVFNVEAVARGTTTYVYYEDGVTGGVYAMTFDGATFSTPVLAVPGASIPKAIVDDTGTIRLTAVDATAWPVVDVLLASSTDGLTFGPAVVAVPGDGSITNWDPTLAQTPDGAYHLFHAPDQADGRQIIEHRTSATFEGLAAAAPAPVTTATDGTAAWWDYWPEALTVGGQLRLFYTSEAGTPPGTGHVWTSSSAVTPATKDQCKDGGYAAFGYRNQGQCVSAAARAR